VALDPYRRLNKKFRWTSMGLRASSPAACRGAEKETMLNPFLAVVLLGFEANHVIHLRVMKIAKGDEAARNEAFLMVDEKVLAALEACGSLFAGRGPEVVINRYREHVAANAKRLAASSANVGTYRANGILRWVSMLRRKIYT
jgi:hypothetical protein